jgi:glycosyltransferase involved in cell wall biosynthesis
MEKDIPLVSICMPAYNAGKYISEAINSIIAQSYQNWELIIVNDGSTDDTAGELKKITDERVKVYDQHNQGQCAAANKAFGFSKGALIKFMDADDMISINHISSQVAVLSGTTKDIAFGSWGRFYDDDIETFSLNAEIIKLDMKPFDWLVQSMTGKQVMLQCALWLIPRSILDCSGLWDDRLCLINDFEFFIRVLLHSQQLKYSENAILYYRSGVPGSLSGTRSAKSARSAYNSINWGTQHLLKVENTPRIRRIAADCFQDLIYTLYPDHKEIVKEARQKVKEYGGSDIPFQAGGYTKILVQLMGWKAAKIIRSRFYKSMSK